MLRRSLALATLALAMMACADDVTITSPAGQGALVTVPPEEQVTLIQNVRLVGFVPGATFKDAAFRDDMAIVRGDGDHSAILDILKDEPKIRAILPNQRGRGIVSIFGTHAYDSHDEGIVIIDIRDEAAPFALGTIELPCGSASHTLKVDPPEGIGHILSARASTTGDCATGFDVIALNLKDLASATVLELPYPTGVTSCRQFALVDGPVHGAGIALCKQGTLDVAHTWDFTEPPNLVVTGTRAAPTGLTWHSAAFGGDGEIVMLAASDGSLHFYDGSDIGGAALAVFTPPQRTSGPRACTGEFVAGASDPYWAVLGCGANGTSVVSVDVVGSNAAVAEYAHFRPAGSNAWSAYWYEKNIYVTDVDAGLFVLKEHGGSRIGHTPRKTRHHPAARRNNPRALSN